MVARLASIAQRYQKVAGSSPAVVINFLLDFWQIFAHVTMTALREPGASNSMPSSSLLVPVHHNKRTRH